MKKIITCLLTLYHVICLAQSNITPQLINTMSGSGVVNNIYYDYSVGEPITLFGGTSCDSIFSGFHHMATDTFRINYLPLTIGGVTTSTTICQGNHVVLTAPTGTAYAWSPGSAITQTLNITTSGIYHVRVTNSCGDTASTNQVVVTVLSPPTPQICEVSTDSTSNYNYNIIYWDNSQYSQADSFIVYRYDAAYNSYLRIGALNKDSSQLMDTASHIGSSAGTNGDPNYAAYKYVLTLKDSCGNESAYSPYHLTEFLQDQHNGNFNVSEYKIENTQSNPVTGYGLLRDDNGTDNFTQITSIPTGATSCTDPNYSSYPNAKYRVDILGFNCHINQRLSNSINSVRIKSHSNSSNNNRITSSISKIPSNYSRLVVYPNPANTVLNITVGQSNATHQELTIYNMLGNIILQQVEIKNQKFTIDISLLQSGVYFIKVGDNVQKFVKE